MAVEATVMTPTATSPPLRRVLQTDFTASKGNALQACFASLYGLDLDDVPNFIADPRGYLDAINSWLASRGNDVQLRKVALSPDGRLPLHEAALDPGTLVLLRGSSPRGSHAHVVVASADPTGRAFVPVMDPHPDTTFLSDDTSGQWVGLLEEVALS